MARAGFSLHHYVCICKIILGMEIAVNIGDVILRNHFLYYSKKIKNKNSTSYLVVLSLFSYDYTFLTIQNCRFILFINKPAFRVGWFFLNPNHIRRFSWVGFFSRLKTYLIIQMFNDSKLVSFLNGIEICILRAEPFIFLIILLQRYSYDEEAIDPFITLFKISNLLCRRRINRQL